MKGRYFRVLPRQRGFSLVELMISIVLGLFLVAGLLMIYVNTQSAVRSQAGIAEIQERQRNAIAMLSNFIQPAGYFPIPLVATDLLELRNYTFPAKAPYTQGAVIFGDDKSVRIRFQAPANDSGSRVLNCHGDSNQTGIERVYDNFFYLREKEELLVCALGDSSIAAAGVAEEVLVRGVKTLGVEYGVDDTGEVGSVTRYLSADKVSDWTEVRAVKLKMGFANPLMGQPGQPDSVEIKHVIQLMGAS
ncbi:MAG: PilW family protein [Betaproteobacteria bacterium]|nr:PilW family protein [Betaproteobacteria bacterium]